MILFNALQNSISAGIGRYSFELSKQLYYKLKNDIKIIVREQDLDDYYFVNSKSLIIFKNINNSRDRNFCEQVYIPKLISEKYRGSIIHYPDSMAPIFLNGSKVVITVHDLAFKSLSNVFTKKTVLWKNLMTNISVKKSKRIICITNFTRDELITYYPKVQSKIDVVYNGFNRLNDRKIVYSSISRSVQKILENKYILTVSTISPRKNIDTLINAFNLIKNRTDANLVIVGSNGWLYESIYKLVDKLDLNDRVIFTGKVNDDELKILYKNSSLFVYPSLYEGFGLPPLEAMSYGVNILVSDVKCLREVLGDSVKYFSPRDHVKLSNSLLKNILDNKNVNHNYDTVLGKYSWEKCANGTIKVYDKILRGV